MISEVKYLFMFLGLGENICNSSEESYQALTSEVFAKPPFPLPPPPVFGTVRKWKLPIINLPD